MSLFPARDLLNAYEAGDPWAYHPNGFQQTGSFAEGVIPFSGMASQMDIMKDYWIQNPGWQ